MKTKMLFLLIVLVTGIVKLEAQEISKKSMFVVSPGYAVFNNGNQNGIFLSNEYIRDINRYFSYGAKLILAQGTGNIKGLEPQHDTHISSTALDLNGFLKPIKSKKHLLLIGLGISLDYTQTSHLSDTDFIISDGKTYTIANTESNISLLEPIFSLHYYYNFHENLFLGLNMNARDLNVYQYLIGIGGGIKF